MHPIPAVRRLYCNRTLNLRAIKAVGFDMDYTLVHYRTEAWERRAYAHVQRRLAERGWPVDGLELDPESVTLGLVIDTELGNIVKPNRFGYVIRAAHGTRALEFDEQRQTYARVLVDLAEPRWVFINTLFALSEACLYAQCVELLDAGKLQGPIGYADLYQIIRASIDEAHMEGVLKGEITAAPEKFVDPDPELPLTLLDLARAGKKLLLITNSEWSYTQAMMGWTLDRWLDGRTWRDLFHLVIVSAQKPRFFTQSNPVYELADSSGLWRQTHKLREGGVYAGGDAGLVERELGVAGDEVMYVGDHIFADVNVSKSVLRWRTALVLRELELELTELERFQPEQRQLSELMQKKELVEHDYAQMRLQLQRLELGYAATQPADAETLRARMQELRKELAALDDSIGPLARAAGELVSKRWGPLLRAGGDKSHLARQIERYADVYTSRVSNFLLHTPFAYLRAARGSLPHDFSDS